MSIFFSVRYCLLKAFFSSPQFLFQFEIFLITVPIYGHYKFLPSFSCPKDDKKKLHHRHPTRSISSTSSSYNSSFNPYEPKTERLKEAKTFNEALMVIVLFVAVSFATAVVLWHLEQKDFLDSLFESVSAVTTTGITTGITSMDMNVVSKVFLIVNMILGRFEIIAVIYLFMENKIIKTRGSEYLKHLHIPIKNTRMQRQNSN